MPPPDLTSLFVAPLNQLGVVYMVTGSVASSTCSHARVTNDIDVVVVLSDIEAERLHAAFDATAFYVPPFEVINLERQRPTYGDFKLIHIDTG